jgi:hypothetical protein
MSHPSRRFRRKGGKQPAGPHKPLKYNDSGTLLCPFMSALGPFISPYEALVALHVLGGRRRQKSCFVNNSTQPPPIRSEEIFPAVND